MSRTRNKVNITRIKKKKKEISTVYGWIKVKEKEKWVHTFDRSVE